MYRSSHHHVTILFVLQGHTIIGKDITVPMFNSLSMQKAKFYIM
nr:unnamed protein product [Callosobruchus chinensis]